MNSTEEIVRKYDKKRAILRKLQYAEQMALPLVFYSAFRFYDQVTDKVTHPFYTMYFFGVFGIIVAKNVYLWSIYGFATTGIGKTPTPLKWRIIVTGILIGLIILEGSSLLIDSMNAGSQGS